MQNLFIQPIKILIEFVFLKILDVLKNHGLSLIVLSVIINIILTPFYYFAENIEKKERDLQNKMKPKIDEFKSVYKGYELHLYIKNVYRLNDYHPLYSLRGLISLLIQVPFFMGAYAYLSNYMGFEGVSFLFLSDLSKPDALLSLGKININVLPFVMTFVNLLSSYVYTKDLDKKEKITPIVIALFFLVILYSSPASLLVYWTMNNVFSLVKNLITYNTQQRKLRGV